MFFDTKTMLSLSLAIQHLRYQFEYLGAKLSVKFESNFPLSYNRKPNVAAF